MNNLKYCVYVLLSLKDYQFYIGYTADLHDRLTAHVNGNSEATQLRRPFRLVFLEFYLSKKDALRREKYFKTTIGKKILRLMLKESLFEISKNFY